MTTKYPSRRAFLRSLGALSTFGLASRLDLVNLVAAANAQQAADYKALVCVFMFGGNDGNNTVVPIDSAGYAQYAAVRPATSGINLAQASLLPIQPVNIGTPFGLHPAMPEVQTLFTQRKLAILGNVGTMIAFRLGLQDAEILEKEFYPEVSANDLVNLANYNFITLAAHGQSPAPRIMLLAISYALVYVAVLLAATILIFSRRNLK